MKRVSITFFALTAAIFVCLSSQANPRYQTPTFETQRVETPRTIAPEFVTPTFPSSRFDTPSGITPKYEGERVQTPPFIGTRFVTATLVSGRYFSDLYIPNPDDRFDAKSVAELARQDMARFGLERPVESPLEASLFPRTQTVIATYIPPLPVFLYSLDDRLQYVQ